jgi:hypothetical protein
LTFTTKKGEKMGKLVSCKECGKEVSMKAKTCPHCGVSNPGITAKDSAKGLGILIGFVALAWLAWPSSDEPGKEEKACAAGDLQCLGDKLVFTAPMLCQKPIESMAKHSARWTDSLTESKFSNFRWKDKAAGSITMIGDRAEFQNAFGAYTNIIYECDIGKDMKTVLDVRITPGRLP